MVMTGTFTINYFKHYSSVKRIDSNITILNFPSKIFFLCLFSLE